MTIKVIWTDEAKLQLAGFRSEHELIEHGLGDRLAAETGAAVDAIESNPLQFAVINRRGTRLAKVNKFDFGVMYRQHGDNWWIISVIPLRSDPAKWMHRG
jgi:hypothetical protein